MKRESFNILRVQGADVGIGLSGQEGMQAVMACDYALARYVFLFLFLSHISLSLFVSLSFSLFLFPHLS